MPSEAIDLYKRFVQVWSAISDQERRKVLDTVLEPEIIYRVSRMEGTGHQVVIEDLHDFRAKFSSGRFTLPSVSEHHNVALVEWQLILPGGTPAVRGHDAVRVTPAGKLGQIVTFAPPTPEPQAS